MKKSILVCAALMLGGCANQGDFPTLAPRAIEQRPAEAATPAVPPVAAVSNPATLARVQAAVAKAQAGVPAFNEALATARTAAGRAGGYASDGWVTAQVAIARLERTREPTQVALIDLTEEQRVVLFGPPSADRGAVEAAMAEVSRIDAGQSAAMNALLASVKRR